MKKSEGAFRPPRVLPMLQSRLGKWHLKHTTESGPCQQAKGAFLRIFPLGGLCKRGFEGVFMGKDSYGGRVVLDGDLEGYIAYLRSMGAGREEIEARTKDVLVLHVVYRGVCHGIDQGDH